MFLAAIIYTTLKHRTPYNTLVGAVVGAVPPVIGWVAQTGSIDPGALTLGALLFLWQLPHFHALSYNLREDYLRGGFKMLSGTHPHRLAINALVPAVAIMPLGVLFAHYGVTDWSFALTSLLPASWMAYKALMFWRETNALTARALFLSSLSFLPAYLGLMLAHHHFLT
jgi:protoheme IX farnesyltransferase